MIGECTIFSTKYATISHVCRDAHAGGRIHQAGDFARSLVLALTQSRWAASRALCWAATAALAAATGAYKAACWLVSWARVVMGDGMAGSFVVGLKRPRHRHYAASWAW